MNMYRTEVVIAGGGLAGIVTAYELLDRGRRVLLIDKDKRENFGGLAKESFGGVHLIGTPHQRRLQHPATRPNSPGATGRASPVTTPATEWPRAWGRFYCENSVEYIYEFLAAKKIASCPLVNWPERGLYAPGQYASRDGTSSGAPATRSSTGCWHALEAHPRATNLELLFDTEVSGIEMTNGRATGVTRSPRPPRRRRARGHRLRRHLRRRPQPASRQLVPALGRSARENPERRAQIRRRPAAPGVAALGGAVTHLDLHWHYAAGVHHPASRRPDDGLSLVPPRSALWLNARGERIMNPGPMLAYGDTRHLVASVLAQPGQYSWQVMNWKIAIRELAVSGCDYMTAFRYKKKLGTGREPAVRQQGAGRAPHSRLPGRHRRRGHAGRTDGPDGREEPLRPADSTGANMEAAIRAWDAMIDRGPAFHNDEQLRRIANFRAYRGDRVRTCKFQKILDPRAGPLIAIREFILARKSLGGIQTDLQCRVLRAARRRADPRPLRRRAKRPDSAAAAFTARVRLKEHFSAAACSPDACRRDGASAHERTRQEGPAHGWRDTRSSSCPSRTRSAFPACTPPNSMTS